MWRSDSIISAVSGFAHGEIYYALPARSQTEVFGRGTSSLLSVGD
jgi:hypothetical protein